MSGFAHAARAQYLRMLGRLKDAAEAIDLARKFPSDNDRDQQWLCDRKGNRSSEPHVSNEEPPEGCGIGQMGLGKRLTFRFRAFEENADQERRAPGHQPLNPPKLNRFKVRHIVFNIGKTHSHCYDHTRYSP